MLTHLCFKAIKQQQKLKFNFKIFFLFHTTYFFFENLIYQDIERKKNITKKYINFN